MSSAPAVVVAAFEPFGGRSENRALEAMRGMRARAERRVLPTAFAPLPAIVPRLVNRARCALLLVGESGAARHPLLERVALNLIDARIADNAGARPRDVPVVEGGPLALAARWPARALLDAAAAAGHRAALSAHAGSFCCNAAFYLALQHASGLPAAPLVGFLHVPSRGRHADDRASAALLDFLVGKLRKMS